jgi:hypothetical protein
VTEPVCFYICFLEWGVQSELGNVLFDELGDLKLKCNKNEHGGNDK